MAAQGMIRPGEGGRFKVVFPYGGQEHEVHSLQRRKEADAVLHCLTTWAMADQQRSLEQSAAGSGAPAAMGSPQQLVQELQACVVYCNGRNTGMFDEHAPAACRLMVAAAAEGHLSVVRQLLVTEPAQALAGLNASRDYMMPLHRAAQGGHAAVFRLLLAAAPEAATHTCKHNEVRRWICSQWSVMHSAAEGGSTAVIEALLELHPDAAGWTSDYGHKPLHAACIAGHLAAARALLQAAPSTATAADSHGDVPLHLAASSGLVAAMQLLLKAAPEAAMMKNAGGQRPFHMALQGRYVVGVGNVFYLGAARTLLPVSGLSPAQLLDTLVSYRAAPPLYADLAARFPLSAAEWEHVPTPCTGLGRALPAVLARSDADARQLVQHLPAADQQHLRLAALCLGREQRRHRVFLPAPLVRAILAQCLL